MAPFDNGYSSNLTNKLSPLIEGQVPDFIQSDHSVFVRFLKHYYQYLESGELRLTVSIDNMLLEVQTESFLLLEDGTKLVLESSVGKFSANETITGATSKATATVLVDDLGNSTKPRLFISGQQQFQTGETITGGTSSATGTVVRYRANPVQNLQQLLEYANTDNTIYDFLDQLRDSFMNAIPKELASGLDQRNLIKNIRELYRAKGTSEGHKIFLRMLLGQSSDIMYPNQFMMRVSDGNWTSQNILRCSIGANSEPVEMVGQTITGQTSGATAVVASAITTAEGSDTLAQFDINPESLVGTFVDGETVQGVSTVQDVTMTFTVRGVVTSYAVTDGGKFYSVGDDLDLDGQTAIGNAEARAEVGSIKQGTVSRVIVDDVGSKYNVGDTVTFTTSEGTTTSDPIVKAASGFVSVIDGSLAIDGTDSSGTDAGDNLILEDGSTSSIIEFNIGLEVATGDGVILMDRSATDGTNAGEKLIIEPATKIQINRDSYGTSNDTFALEEGTVGTGAISRIYVKDGGQGYSLLPTVSVTSNTGSGAALLADTNDIGAVDSVNITNQGFKYTVAPEGRFRANFLLKDVTGTFSVANTISTSGMTGTIKNWDSTTKVLKTTFEDVERMTMETGTDQGIRLENSLLTLSDEPGNTDFFLYTGTDVYTETEGDLLLETGDSILMDASAEVGIDRFVAEDELNNVFLIQENGDPEGSIINSRVDGPGNGFISEVMGNPNPIPPTSNTPLIGDRVVLEAATTSGTDFLIYDGTDVSGTNSGSRILFENHGPAPVNYIRPINPLRSILNENAFAIPVNENDSIRTDSTQKSATSGAIRLLLETGDKLIGESTGNNIRLEESLADFTDGTSFRVLGDSPALSGNIEIDGTNSNSADAGDDIVFEDAPDFSSETLTITDSGGATGTIVSVDIAKGTSSIGTIAETTPSYSNIENLVGEALNRIQDSVYYQQFSYEVQAGAGGGEYIKELKKAVHPAGFNIFSKVSIATQVSVALPTVGSSLGGGYTADTDTFSPILASTFTMLFQETVSRKPLVVERPVAGFDDKLVLETDNPIGDLALEAATVSSDTTGRLISETETYIGDRIVLETSSTGNEVYLLLDRSDTSNSHIGEKFVSESAEAVTFNLALEPAHTLNGGDFLPGGIVPTLSTLVLEDAFTGSIHNTGDKLEVEVGTSTRHMQNSFFSFDVSTNDKVLDENSGNQYLETAGIGHRNLTGERSIVVSRVVAKISLPRKLASSIPNGSIFLGENPTLNVQGGISLEVGNTGGGGNNSLLLNGFNQVNVLGNVDRITGNNNGWLLEDATDSNLGAGITFKHHGEYRTDFIVLNGSDGSSSNAGDNIVLEAGTLTDTRHRLKSMVATNVLTAEVVFVRPYHTIKDIIRPPRLVAVKDDGEVVNIVSEHVGASGSETISSPPGSIKLEDSLLVNSNGNLLLEIEGPLGNKYALESNPSYLVPEDSNQKLHSGVVPPENYAVSSVRNIEPLMYSSDVTKRPVGGISFESTGQSEVHIRLEDGTVGVIAGSHRPAGDGFLVADSTSVTQGDTTTYSSQGTRLGYELSLGFGRAEFGLGHGVIALNKATFGDNDNVGERIIQESATIYDYLENTEKIPAVVTSEFSFDSVSYRYDQTGFTYDSTL